MPSVDSDKGSGGMSMRINRKKVLWFLGLTFLIDWLLGFVS